jgi:hypothetical protein
VVRGGEAVAATGRHHGEQGVLDRAHRDRRPSVRRRTSGRTDLGRQAVMAAACSEGLTRG